MGNTDSVPVISQLKSLVQVISGDTAGALYTQQQFAFNNTFPVISQIESAIYAAEGKMDQARDLQEKFLRDWMDVVDSIPGPGHVKGAYHYAMGDTEAGDESMRSATRTLGVLALGTGGALVGGPPGAVAGGITGGVFMDSAITGVDTLAQGDGEILPYGYQEIVQALDKAAKGKQEISSGEAFDMAMMLVGDGAAGLSRNKPGKKIYQKLD